MFGLAGVEARTDYLVNSSNDCLLFLSASKDSGGEGRGVFCARTKDGGNPPTLTRLLDGRLCITYGYRAKPFGMRARLSSDSGSSWGEEIVLRDDAGNHDIGYPRTVQRPDGTIVTLWAHV